MKERLESYIEEDILTLTLPGQRANVLDKRLLTDLCNTIRQNRKKKIIISSEGEVFSAGLDLGQILDDGDAKVLLDLLVELFNALTEHPHETACLVRAPAIAGGVGLALCADAVAMTCDASFTLPSDPLYRPLADVLFPIVAARRGVERADFERWFRMPARANDLRKKEYVDAVIHNESEAEVPGRLKSEVLKVWQNNPGLAKRRKHPNPIDVAGRVTAAIAASKLPLFHVGIKKTLGQIKTDHRDVFIVHGRNLKAVNIMATFLRAIGLRHLSLPHVATRLGASAPHTWNLVYAGLAMAQAIIVLLTGDEIALLSPHLAGRGTPDVRWQARPNVLLEAGIALGMYTHRTILVCRSPDLLPSDLAGHLAITVEGVDWRDALIGRLESARCRIKRTSRKTWPKCKELVCAM